MPFGIHRLNCPRRKANKFIPQDHQKFVRDYFVNSSFKGLLLYHRLGSGKTCSSIIIADTLLRLKKIDRVYILSPGSLRSGWEVEYCDVCGKKGMDIEKRYDFVTYNYSLLASQMPTDFDFDKSLVIIDEVHNFINSVKNESTNAMLLWKKLTECNSCKILALSGTPIYNNIYEMGYLGYLLKPESFSFMVGNNGKMKKYNFVIEYLNIDVDGTVTPRNESELAELLFGIISYFPGLGSDYYPELIREPIQKVIMTPTQEKIYWPAFKSEEKRLRMGMPKPELRRKDPEEYEKQKIQYILAKKRIISRKPSNFVYPDLPNIEKKSRKANMARQKENRSSRSAQPSPSPSPSMPTPAAAYTADLMQPPDAIAPRGWVERKCFEQSQIKKIYSTKFTRVFENILDNFNSKHMIFSFFKTKCGVQMFKAICDMCGIKARVYSGDQTETVRRNLLRQFNLPENRYGEKIKVILVTDAGAEGITLKEVGHVHILESDYRENKIEQVIGRVVRFKSHYDMPKHLQKVHVWRYWSVSRKLNVITIDEILYHQGQIKKRALDTFYQILIENSIENYF